MFYDEVRGDLLRFTATTRQLAHVVVKFILQHIDDPKIAEWVGNCVDTALTLFLVASGFCLLC